MALEPQRGEIYLVRLPGGGEGSEQQGQRPAVVVSNDISNAFSPVVIVAAMTTAISRREQPWDVLLKAGQPLEREGRVMCNQLFTLAKDTRLVKRLGALSPFQMVNLDHALKVSLGLDGTVPAAP